MGFARRERLRLLARYPETTFSSKRIDRVGPGYSLVGDLSLHGAGGEVTLEADFGGIARDHDGTERARFSATTAINRRDFGLIWDTALEMGSVVVGRNVGIAVELEAVRRAAATSVAA